MRFLPLILAVFVPFMSASAHEAAIHHVHAIGGIHYGLAVGALTLAAAMVAYGAYKRAPIYKRASSQRMPSRRSAE